MTKEELAKLHDLFARVEAKVSEFLRRPDRAFDLELALSPDEANLLYLARITICDTEELLQAVRQARWQGGTLIG